MKKITLIMSLFFLLLIGPSKVHAQDMAEAEKITTTINVTATGKMEVTQQLDMYFNVPRQGIFVTIPQRYTDMVIDGVKQDFYMPVSNLKVLDGEEVEVDSDLKGVVMRIGEPGVYIEGPKTYTYQYDVQMYPWTGTDTDIFYMDVISNAWEFPVHSNDFVITFPEDLSNEVYIYATQDNLPVDYKVEGNVISGSFNETLRGQALTVETTLGENYFDYPNNDFSIPILTAQVGITILIVFLYLKYGKDYHVVDSVEFTAPDDLSSADVGYVYRGAVSNDDVISLIIYWASKGFLLIEELENDEMELTKVKDMSDDYPAEERRIFKALFAKGDVANTKTLSNKFGATLQNARQTIPQSFSSDPKRRVFERKGLVFKYLFILLIPVFSLGLYGSLMYAKVPSIEYAIPFAMLFFVPSTMLWLLGLKLFDNSKEKSKIFSKIIYLLAFSLLNVVIWFLLFKNDGTPTQIKIALQALMTFISVILLSNMSRRTRQGTRWYGQILGLKRFIETAEKDRLIMLAEETPSIFYDILPFAFTLGITDVWSKKFRDIYIEQPDWYRTQGSPNFTSMYMWSSLNRSINTMRPAMTSIPGPTGKSGGGGSFGGGGFSGGGGSSGGGFGGAGGGSW